MWFTEYQSPMEINDSQDRAPFGDLTNHTNEGNWWKHMIEGITWIKNIDALITYVLLFKLQGLTVNPIYSQQPIVLCNVRGKGKEQGMQQCRRKRRMRKIWGDVKRIRKRKVLHAFHFCGVTNTLHVIWMDQYFSVVTN